MLTASDSENNLPVFPFLSLASRHDSIGFLYNWYSMKQFLPDAVVIKLLPDAAHDAMPYYECCRVHGINGNITYTCENPYSDAKYRRTVHLIIKDNPRLIRMR